MKIEIQFFRKNKISYLFFILSFCLAIIFISNCKELTEMEVPIQFTNYIVGEGKYTSIYDVRLLRSKQMRSYYAVIEVTEYLPEKKEIKIQKNWFKKTKNLRREVTFIGAVPQAYVSGGKQSWNFSLFRPQIAFKNKYGLEPDFFIFKISQRSLKKIKQQLEVVETEKEYVYEDQFIENDYKTTTKIWLDKDSLLPIKWEQKSYNPDSILLQEKTCNEIKYDISFPDSLFKIPKGLEVRDNIGLYEQISPLGKKTVSSRLTQGDIDTLTSIEKDLNKILKKCPDNAQGYYDLANLALLKNDLEKTIQLYQKTLELDEEHFPAYEGMISLYIYRNQKDKALVWIKKYRRVRPPELSSEFYFLGDFYEKVDLIEEAVQLYEMAVKLQKDDIYISKKGETLRIEGLRKKYRETYERVLEKLKKKKAALIK